MSKTSVDIKPKINIKEDVYINLHFRSIPRWLEAHVNRYELELIH